LSLLNKSVIQQLVNGHLNNGFEYLGFHSDGKKAFVNVYLPGAKSVAIVTASPGKAMPMRLLDEAGIFSREVPSALGAYQLEVEYPLATLLLEDPYRFSSGLREDDVWLFSEGRLNQTHKLLGAHLVTHEGVEGVQFSVWAPNAQRVAVIGDFNHFNLTTHILRFHPASGIWEMFIPGVSVGATYRFDIIGQDGGRYNKSDPLARTMITENDSFAVVIDDEYEWRDADWLAQRSNTDLSRPLSIYEVHAGSWRAVPGGHSVDYESLAADLLDYVVDLGFTHIQFMPLSEHPFTGSWGYQPLGMFAPTRRFGTGNGLRALVDAAHQRGIGVLLDWVPAHFPKDDHGLARFDGTALYEHEDPRRGEHPDWGTLIYNYGRAEVVSFLISNALYWIEEFHIDGLRIDAVASMLYLDYSRNEGEWLPNQHGGRENLEAVALLQQMNTTLHERFPGVLTIAEESTSWPGVTAPVAQGGLGFSFKWNMGWMHDSLNYIQHDPIYRKYHHDDITFSMVYAYSEQFVLPYSHDEVVHGKGSLLGKMPGDDWQKAANLRALFGYMWGHPGKKHIFMGSELGAPSEWNHDGYLDWSLLEQPLHAGVHKLVADLNRLYRSMPALHAADGDPAGFSWCIRDDSDNSVLAFERSSSDGKEKILVVINFTPVVRYGYKIPVAMKGRYTEILNTDSKDYGGSNVGNTGSLITQADGDRAVLALTLPPLAAFFMQAEL